MAVSRPRLLRHAPAMIAALASFLCLPCDEAGSLLRAQLKRFFIAQSLGDLSMDNISAAGSTLSFVIAGVLQAWGPPMNNALKNALVNPWLGSLVSFLPVVAFLGVVALCLRVQCRTSPR